MGFPIRKSAGRRLLTPHRSLSQRATSFIACVCQGIHQLPLPHARESTPPSTILLALHRSRSIGGLVLIQIRPTARGDGSAQLDNQLICECRSNCFDRQPRHRFLDTIHNVKDGGEHPPPANRRISCLHSWKKWWSQSGSKRRPQACKASALPTELWPHWISLREHGGPRRTRTSDLTLIRRTL